RHVKNTIGFTKLVPGLMHHLDYPDVASLAMPSALLVINGSKDGLFDLDGVRQCFAKLSACYDKAGVPRSSAAGCTTRPTSSTHRCSRRRGTGWRGGCDRTGPRRGLWGNDQGRVPPRRWDRRPTGFLAASTPCPLGRTASGGISRRLGGRGGA